MKTSNRILSLLLALAIALSLVIPTATPASAAGVDTYIAGCTAYAASLQVKTTAETPLMTYPCTTATQSGSSVYETLAAGTALHVTKLYMNTAGEYWYAVSHNLTTCYVKASDTTMLEHLVGDVTATGVMSPASLAYGDAFSLEGNITSSVNKLGTITASMYRSSNLTKAPVITASDTPSGNSYSLKGSTVDNKLAFNALSTGTYTYLLTADAISYYIDDSGKLATAITTVILDKQYAVVTDVDNPNPSTAFGIDVSVHNGYIDWSQAKNDIDFAILRIGWEYTLDTRFLEYAAGCVANDIPFGVYIYSYAETEAEGIAEAEFVINTLRSRGYNPELPIFFDFEDECQVNLSSDLKYKIIRGFCDTIEDAGYQPGVYTFLSWMNTIYTSYFDTLPIWVAQIDGYTSNGTCSFDGGLHMWQYSWTGRISGISSNVDCNLYYADFLGKDADTSYLSQCTAYPSNLTVKTKDSVNLRQYPSTSYSTLKTLSAGTELHVTGVYKNTNGELWYQVIENGTTGYILATYAEVLEYRYDDISVIKPSMADNINVGSAYSIKGILNSQYNQMNKVYAKIYNGESTLATPSLNSSHTLNDRRYNLYASEVDYNLAFNQLSAGYYTYEISADVKNYYVNASGSLTSVTENVVLWQHPFTVGTANICTNGHSYGSWTVTKNATCSSEGSKYRTCSNCSVKDTVTIPASSHSYTSVTVPATCKEYAKTTYTCTACGHSYTESGSGMTQWSTTKPTGVAENLIETKTQYRYSDYETKTSYESSLAGYTQVSSAWDTATSGTIQYVKSWPTGYDTSNSLYSTYNKTPKTAGTTTTTKTTVSSDTVTGYIYYHWCTNAFSDGPYNRLIKPTKQGEYTTFHAFYSTTAPGSLSDYDPSDSSYVYNNGACCMDTYWYFCTEVRTQKYTTQKKLFTYERWTDWSAWSDTAVSTTATRKVETQTLYRYATGELGEHAYNAVVTKPTCSAGGYTTYTCTACGDSYTSDQTSAVDHSYVNGKCTWCGTSEPVTQVDYYLIGYINGKDYGCESDSANMGTYKFEDGKLTAKFDTDSYIFIKTTNNTNWYMTDGWLGTNATTATLYNTTLDIEHNKLFVPGGVELTFTLTVNADGTLTLSYAVTETPIEKIDIAFSQIDMGNTLGMRFAFPASADINWTGAYVVATMGGNTQTIPATEWETANIGGTNHYVFGFNNIAAKQMADEISIVIYNADGKAVSNEYVDSIQSYVMRNVDKKDAEAKALMVDMLNYGAAAQTYYGYNTSDLANAQLTDAQKAYGTATKPEITDGRVKGANYLGTRLELGSSIGMQMNFKGTTANMYAVVEFTNHSGTKVSERVAPTEISGTYLIVIDQIVVADGRMPITVTVYNANGTVYGSATDSMASYIARMSNADALYECIMKFSDSAHAYLH